MRARWPLQSTLILFRVCFRWRGRLPEQKLRIKIKTVPSVLIQWKCLATSKTIPQPQCPRRLLMISVNTQMQLNKLWNSKLAHFRSLCQALVPSRTSHQTYFLLMKFTKLQSWTLGYLILIEMLATSLSRTASMVQPEKKLKSWFQSITAWPYQTHSRSVHMT